MTAATYTIEDALGSVEYISDGVDWIAVHHETSIFGCGSTPSAARENLIEAFREFADVIDQSPRVSAGLEALRGKIPAAALPGAA